MTAPETFVAALARYDARLRVRWGARTHRWIIERKMPERSPSWLRERPSPYRSPRGLDAWDGWREGYVVVMFVDPEMLHWSVVEPELAESDAVAQGGFAALSRKLDAQAEQEDAATDRTIANWSAAASSEAYDRLMWLQGNRIATPFAEVPEPLVPTEQHDGFVVRMRRSMDARPLPPIHDSVGA